MADESGPIDLNVPVYGDDTIDDFVRELNSVLAQVQSTSQIVVTATQNGTKRIDGK